MRTPILSMLALCALAPLTGQRAPDHRLHLQYAQLESAQSAASANIVDVTNVSRVTVQ